MIAAKLLVGVQTDRQQPLDFALFKSFAALELAIETTQPREDGAIVITREIAEESIQQRAVLYDRDGDAHYDTISAFIKSIRGSDPDAALYWMAKMLYAGEDPRFIFRRMIISAGEDVGLADPKAMGVVLDAARCFDYVGMPEGRYHLAHACLYLATAPKSNSSMAFFDALKTVALEIKDEVPNHLKDASRDGDGFGHGVGYLYPHAYRDHWVAQQYLPDTLQGKVFFQPTTQGYEATIKERVDRQREAQMEALLDDDDTSPLSTTTGKNIPHMEWLDRTISRRGQTIGIIREELVRLAQFERNNLVLDLNARSGLLSLESLRHVPEGGVWSIAHDEKSYKMVCDVALKLPPLGRPTVLQSTLYTIVDDLKMATNEVIKFDRIIGRNCLTRSIHKEKNIADIVSLLSTSGMCVLAETVPSAGQRISLLVELTTLDTELVGILKKAEDELFLNVSDPMVNWSTDSLLSIVKKLPEREGSVTESISNGTRRITPDAIDFWLRETDGDRQSLGDRIAFIAGKENLTTIKQVLHRKLDYQEVPWRTAVAWVVVK